MQQCWSPILIAKMKIKSDFMVFCQHFISTTARWGNKAIVFYWTWWASSNHSVLCQNSIDQKILNMAVSLVNSMWMTNSRIAHSELMGTFAKIISIYVSGREKMIVPSFFLSCQSLLLRVILWNEKIKENTKCFGNSYIQVSYWNALSTIYHLLQFAMHI